MGRPPKPDGERLEKVPFRAAGTTIEQATERATTEGSTVAELLRTWLDAYAAGSTVVVNAPRQHSRSAIIDQATEAGAVPLAEALLPDSHVAVGPQPDKVIDLLAALEDSVTSAKASRKGHGCTAHRDGQHKSKGGPVAICECGAVRDTAGDWSTP